MNRFIAIQVGARRNYAIPAILEEAGMLEALYTDLCADAGIGQWLNHYCPEALKQKGIKRILDRKLPPTIRSKTKTCDRSAIQFFVRQQLASVNSESLRKALVEFSQAFGKEAISKGLGQATHIFSMFGEGFELMKYAKQNGLKIVTEIYLSPETHRIVQAEQENYPELEPKLTDKVIEKDYEHFSKVCQLTDTFLVPSRFVQEGLEAFGVNVSQCQMVPYAVDDSWFGIENRPVKGRILFVGTAELRKGIHILGQAAQKLAHRGYEFRVAGNVSKAIRQHPVTRELTFLGRVPRTHIKQEYAQADIFVLPSLAEGSAEVTYEALAAGLPVITTAAAGSVIRNGIEGYIIPEKDSEELAICIKEIVENRNLRNQMSQSARLRVKDFTWQHYGKRLLEIFTTV